MNRATTPPIVCGHRQHRCDVIKLPALVAAGGEVLKPPYPEGDLWVATLRDPAGNAVGVWQQGPR